jgi:drug/metabolite transporter (DMT)-like permease
MVHPMSTAAPLPLSARLALPALLLGATGIAFAPIFVRLSEIGPVSTAVWRLALSWPLLLLWMTWEDRKNSKAGKPPRKPQTLGDWVKLSLPGLFFAGDLAVWHISITLTTVANSTLLANFAPVFVTLFGWVLFQFRPSKQFILGMALAMGGAITLMGESLTISPDHLLGDGLGLITAVFYAAYILSIGRLRAIYSTATIMAWSAVSNTIILLVVALLMGESLWPQTAYAWSVLVALAVISHVGGQSLIAYALAHLPAAFGSVSLLWQPACAALLAWALLGEPLSSWQAAGGLVVLMGIFLARRGSRKA